MLDTVVYPTDAVAEFMNGNFVNVRISVGDYPKLTSLFNVTWTPTLLFLDDAGTPHYRIEPGATRSLRWRFGSREKTDFRRRDWPSLPISFLP